MLIQSLGQSAVNTNASVNHMAQVLADQAGSRDGNQGYRALKPKKDMTRISADNARILMTELMQFEVDLNELGLVCMSGAAYRQLRAMCEGKANDVLNIEQCTALDSRC